MVPRQLTLTLRTHGGRRRGAGRKPKGARAGVSHAARPTIRRLTPVHVTLRMRREVHNLRSRRCYRAIHRCLTAAQGRFGAAVVHHSVQGNHIHMIVEVGDSATFARAMQGLAIRLAKALNRVMGRSGRVFADRYHARLLRTPREVRHALVYVLNNARKHAMQAGRLLPQRWLDPYSSASAFDGWRCAGSAAPALPEVGTVPGPRSWLLRVGWRRHGLITPDALPSSPARRSDRRAAPGELGTGRLQRESGAERWRRQSSDR